MRRFVLAIALACAVSSTAFAGIIHSTDVAAPPPPDATAQTDLPGEIPSTGFTSPGDMPTCGLSVLLTAFGLVF